VRQLKAAYLPPSAKRAAVSLGTIAPALTPSKAIAYLDDVPCDQMVAFWYQHRVLRLAMHRLAIINGDTARRIEEHATDQAGAARRRISALSEARGQLETAAADLGIGISGIKGLTMQGCYEIYGPRDLGDIDVMLAGADEAWALGHWLRRRGWKFLSQELPWIKISADGQVYGQLLLANDHGGRIDIHFGGYSVRHNGLIPICPPQPGLSVASLETNFGYLLANAAGDHVVRLKELNDIVVYLRTKGFDWAAAQATIRKTCLEGYWNALVDRTIEFENLGEMERELAQSLLFPHVSAERPGFGVPDLRARRRATVRHARRYARRQTRRSGLRALLSASVYYRMPLRLTVLPVPGLPRKTLLSRAASDRCVRLAPLSFLVSAVPPVAGTWGEPFRGSDNLRQIRIRSRQFAAGAGEIFVPTVYFMISRAAIRRASAAAGQLAHANGSTSAATSSR
jgi:hypothetical protein